jgi:hypothetical protein
LHEHDALLRAAALNLRNLISHGPAFDNRAWVLA